MVENKTSFRKSNYDMSTLEIIKEFKRHNVIPRLDGDQLKLVGETGRLSEEFIAAVRSAKDELIAFLKDSRHQSVASGIQPVPIQDYYPASNAQKRIWFLSQFKGGSCAYNIGTGLLLKGDVDAD